MWEQPLLHAPPFACWPATNGLPAAPNITPTLTSSVALCCNGCQLIQQARCCPPLA